MVEIWSCRPSFHVICWSILFAVPAQRDYLEVWCQKTCISLFKNHNSIPFSGDYKTVWSPRHAIFHVAKSCKILGFCHDVVEVLSFGVVCSIYCLLFMNILGESISPTLKGLAVQEEWTAWPLQMGLTVPKHWWTSSKKHYITSQNTEKLN